MFQFQDLEEKNEVVKNAFLYLLDKSAGKGMVIVYFEPLVQGQRWGSCALQTGASTIEHTYICSVYLHLVILALFSTSKPNNKAKAQRTDEKTKQISYICV
jgi:hypothetical protein